MDHSSRVPEMKELDGQIVWTGRYLVQDASGHTIFPLDAVAQALEASGDDRLSEIAADDGLPAKNESNDSGGSLSGAASIPDGGYESL